MGYDYKVTVTYMPTEDDWKECKRRALYTSGFTKVKTMPDEEWKKKILLARHSPIRSLRFTVEMTIPYFVSVHLVRHHEGVQFYVQSQRNDRQDKYDRNTAPQGAMVNVLMDINADALITLCQKRLCRQASKETRWVVNQIREQVIEKLPEFKDVLVPPCVMYGKCNEMSPCYGWKKED